VIGVGTFKASEKARRYVNQALDSGRLSYGPFVQEFERRFAASHDCRYGIMSNSGTSSLLTALAALKEKFGWKDGDEVIVPAITFIATSNIVLQLNMTPVFVDVDPVYYELNPMLIEQAITPRTRCIIPVHLFGQPCDMDPILSIAQSRNLKIIEDSCETMFARYRGRLVGSFGDIGCFSTYIAHILVTGVGGLCTTNEPDLAVVLRSLINHGRDSIYLSIDDSKGRSAEELRMVIARRFSFVRMGYSFRPTELEGALGLAQLEEMDANIKTRRANGRLLTDSLSRWSHRIQLPAIRPDTEHSFMMFPIVLRDEPKTDLVNFLEQRGVETRDMLPLITHKFYQNLFALNEADFPIARWINQSGFYIASHQDLTRMEIEYIANVFDEFFENKNVVVEGTTLLVMSNLPASEYSEVLLEQYCEKIPLDRFTQLVLLDGGHNQNLQNFMSKKGFEVLDTRASKTQSFLMGLERVTGENVVVIGIDGSDNVVDIDKILIALNRGVDLVLPSRFMAGGSRSKDGPLAKRSVGNRFFAFLVGLLSRKNVTDPNNLFRGFKRTKIAKLDLSASTLEVMFDMTMGALRRDLKISEFPTAELPVKFTLARRSRWASALSFFGILAKYPFKSKKGSAAASRMSQGGAN
jgi:perosamine synthetase